MADERTPLTQAANIPPYVFMTNHNRAHRNKIRKFQCCICAAIMAVFVTALVITVSYAVNEDIDDENINLTDTSSSAKPLLTLSLPTAEQAYGKWDDIPSNDEIVLAIAEGRRLLLAKQLFEEKVIPLQVDSPSYRHQMATKTSPMARQMSNDGYILEAATKELSKNWKKENKGHGPTVDESQLDACKIFKSSDCSVAGSSPYRTPDGTCNNLAHPSTWGVAMRPFRRILPPQYADGISSPRLAADGSRLPTAREVSLSVHRPLYRDDPNFTVMLAVWGQYIDHDITATALSQGKSGESISCCAGYRQSGLITHPECYPVRIASPDPYFTDYNATCMEFVRSAPALTCKFGPREQLNQASAFLDGSVIYGTTEAIMRDLRTLKGGELKMLVTPDGRELLPISTDMNDGCNREEETSQGRYCFASGDPRSNENVHLTTMHLLWARHHNKIARSLAAINPHWDDERLFQESRKIVSAQLQHITYNEFLPVILGPNLMNRLKMTARTKGYSNNYDPNLDPSIANGFAASAFRFGHTLLPGLVRMISGDNSSDEFVEMHKMLFNPFQIYDKGFIEKTLRGALNTPVEKTDAYFNKEFTQHLFERKPSVGHRKPMCGLDLVSLNVQRGRDHGLAGYTAFRERCGLSRPTSFEQLQSDMDLDSLQKLKEIYKNVDDIDMYTGALSEIPLEGSLVGPTITCILTDQFLRLQRGDRYWYEGSVAPQGFTLDQLNSIRQTTLAKIICDTSSIEASQPYVMRGKSQDNLKQPCDTLPGLNFDAWKDCSSAIPDSSKEVVEEEEEAYEKYWYLMNSFSPPSKVIKFGGMVTDGAVVVDGQSVVPRSLPLRMSTKSLKNIFNHDVSWIGKINVTDNTARIVLEFSVPTGMGTWYNGDITLSVDMMWNSTSLRNTLLRGNFSTSIYFHASRQFDYLRNQNMSDFKLPPIPSTCPRTISGGGYFAPLILVGTYSADEEFFLWSGKVIIIVPDNTPPSVPNLQLSTASNTLTKIVRIGGSVRSASVTAQNYNVWTGQTPIALPVPPFDEVASGTDSNIVGPIVYGHSLRWDGSITFKDDNIATLSASYSLPLFKHSNGIVPFSIQWYNGDITADLDIAWISCKDKPLKLDGVFSSSIHFGVRAEYRYLRDRTLPVPFTKSIPSDSIPTKPSESWSTPLVLLGTYSTDGSSFLWSGNFTLALPQTVPLPPIMATASSAQNKVKISDIEPMETPNLHLSPEPNTYTKIVKFGGSVKTASVTAQNRNVWTGQTPIALPAPPFDEVATGTSADIVDPIVYGHSLRWTGSITFKDDNTAVLSASYSLPLFIHSNGIVPFSIQWYNGDITADLDIAWLSCKNKPSKLDGVFSTYIHFGERSEYGYLRNNPLPSPFNNLNIPTADVPLQSVESWGSPLVLLGSYSKDRTSFLWSGNFTLALPQVVPIPSTTVTPPLTQNNVKIADIAPIKAPKLHLSPEPKTYTNIVRIGGSAKSASVTAQNRNVWTGQTPIALPAPPFDEVATGTTADIVDPIVYGHSLRWTGSITFKDDNTAVLSASYSLPLFIHSNGIVPFSIQWYNGDITAELDIAWLSSKQKPLKLDGVFSTYIHFGERSEYGYLRNKPLPGPFNNLNLPTADVPLQSVESWGSPLVLLGTYSKDRTSFLWSGNFTLALPQVVPIPSMMVTLPSSKSDSVSLRLVGGNVFVKGVQVWSNTIPVGIPVQIVSSVSSATDPSQATDNLGHSIIWKASMFSKESSFIKITGQFSFPQSSPNISWFNGNFNLKLQSNSSLSLDTTFKSTLHFVEKTVVNADADSNSLYENLQSFDENPSKAASLSDESYRKAPLVMYGTYSSDRTLFLWSGEVDLVLNTNNLESASVSQSVSAFVAGGSLTASGQTLWVGNRVPLIIPTILVDGKSIVWSGFLKSDGPGSVKIWGSYSFSPAAQGPKMQWLNGDFALDTKILENITPIVNQNGTFETRIALEEQTTETATAAPWNLSPDELIYTMEPANLSNTAKPTGPLVLLGSFSSDRKSFTWSGHIRFSIPL